MDKANMRILVVFYSLEGNTRMIGKAIAEETGGSILELKPIRDISPKSPLKYLTGGKQAVIKTSVELLPYEFKPDEYDLLIIGTPVWAWTFAPALRTFFINSDIKGKKIALFTCNGGQNGKTFEHMKVMLQGNEFLGEMEFFEPLKTNKGKSLEQAKSWVKDMTSKVSQ